MARYALIGPTHPFRGGIAHYTTLLAEALRREHELLFISFAQQYPTWLFPGRSDRDPSERPLRSQAEYLLDPLNPLSWRRALNRLAAWRPDVVVMEWWHPFWAPAWGVIGRGIKRLAGRPRLLFICHNVLPHESSALGGYLWPWTARLVLSPGDGFVVHSQADSQTLRHLLPCALIRVTPHPTYAALGETAAALPVVVPDDRPLLLFAGFVRPYKGLDVLLAALPRVLAARPVHLLVAGEFWQGTAVYQAQIAELGLATAVTLLDAYLPNETLAACIQRADVMVLPYRSATQSGVIQLAFGQGKPVITTNVGGLAEVVAHEKTGLVVPPEDPAALAAAIERFFAEELGGTMAENVMGENGRFGWEKLVIQLESMRLAG